MEAPPLQLGLKASWSILLACLPLPYVKTALLPLQDAAAKCCPAAGEQPSPDNWTSLVMALIFFTSKILKTRWPSPWRLLGQYRYTRQLETRLSIIPASDQKENSFIRHSCPQGGMVSSTSCLSSILASNQFKVQSSFPPHFIHCLSTPSLSDLRSHPQTLLSLHPPLVHIEPVNCPSVTKRSKRNHGIYSASRKPDVLKLDQKW